MNFVIRILLSVSGLSKSLLSFLHFRNIISDIAAGLREGCFCVWYISSSLISHSAGHQSKCPGVISIEWMADNNLVCCVIIRTYWCDEQLGVRCVCVVHRPRIVLVLLLDTNVSIIACIFGRWFFTFLIQSEIYSQLLFGFKTPFWVHCHICDQHFITFCVCLGFSFRGFLCRSSSHCCRQKRGICGDAIVPSLVLELPVQNALSHITNWC